jgi:flagellar L-ring protein precursor FlgH
MKYRTLGLLLLIPWLLAGCLKMQNAESMPVMTPIPEPEETDDGVSRNPGSLYQAGTADYLFSDNRARRVGDIVGVKIVESSNAKSQANTDTQRDSSMEIGVASFFKEKQIAAGPFTGDITSTGKMIDTSLTNKMKGKGTTDRKNVVKAVIGARVVKVLPGGLLQVEGAREVRVNEETQFMVIRGLVRPRDIGADNTVESIKLANSTVEYYGKGVLADKQKAGWLMRLVENVWPF